MIQNTRPAVLIVDDEDYIRTFLTEALEPVASTVMAVGSAGAAVKAIEGGDFDIIVCDLFMPGTNGLELLAMAHRCHWDVAMLLVSGRPEVSDVIAALQFQAADFLLKPFDLRVLHESIVRAFRQLTNQREARQTWGAMQHAIQRRNVELESALQQLEQNSQATLEALVAALDAREHETFTHSFRVRAYTMQIARLAGYPPALLAQLEYASLLHDVGKIAVPDSILLKPGKLTAEEYQQMKIHPLVGEEILNRVTFLRVASVTVRHHHERFDGTGYPDGLAGDQIPLGARIFTLADTLDAITSDRCYRKAQSFEAAATEIERCSGSQFDPRLVAVFRDVNVRTWEQRRTEVDSIYSQTANRLKDLVQSCFSPEPLQYQSARSIAPSDGPGNSSLST